MNGSPATGVTVEAIACDGSVLPADWPAAGITTLSTAEASGDNYLLLFVTGFGDGTTPGPAGSLTFASPANGAWYTPIVTQVKFSYPGYQPILLDCDQIYQAYAASLSNANPGVLRVNVNLENAEPPPPTALQSGDTKGIGFWRNKNGQALIKSLNRSPEWADPVTGDYPDNLGNWLAASFPWLYGEHSTSNLAGQPNEAVAKAYLRAFSARGPKVEAQMMAVALAVYVTDSDLAGNVGTGFGFNVSTTGTGAKSFNVKSKGKAIGLENNTSYTVMTLLQQADLQRQLGQFDAKAFNTIFAGINGAGD